MARKTYKIEVTPLDIERAIRNDSYMCVVAQAIQRAVPEASHILVDLQTIRFTVDDHRLQYLTGEKVAQYVVGFEAGDPIEPFQFTLYKPRVTRRQHRRVDPSARRVKAGSPGHSAKKAQRHPKGQTFGLVGSDGSVAKEEVLAASRAAPVTFSSKKGRARLYGSRWNRGRAMGRSLTSNTEGPKNGHGLRSDGPLCPNYAPFHGTHHAPALARRSG